MKIADIAEAMRETPDYRVVIVADSELELKHEAFRDALDEFAHDPFVRQIRRANGRMKIELVNGSHIHFISRRSVEMHGGIRGYSLNLVATTVGLNDYDVWPALVVRNGTTVVLER